MNLYYIIMIIILVTLGVFWTSSPRTKDDLVFFAKKPDPPPKKPPVTTAPQPKKKGGAPVAGKSIKMTYKQSTPPKPADKKKVERIQQQIADAQKKLEKTKPDSKAREVAQAKLAELQVQLSTAQGQQAPSINSVDKKKVEKIQQQIADAQIELKNLKPGSQAIKDAQTKLDRLQEQLYIAQGVQTKDSSSTVNFGGAPIPTLLGAREYRDAANKSLAAAQSAYKVQPTSGNKAILKAAEADVAAAHAGYNAANAAIAYTGVENTVAKTQAIYDANPTEQNKTRLEKVKTYAASAKKTLGIAQAVFNAAQKAAEHAQKAIKCVSSKGKICPIMDDNNSGFSQTYINQVQNYASDVYAQMAKDFPSLFDPKRPMTIHLGLDEADAQNSMLAKLYKDSGGFWLTSMTIRKDYSPAAINSVVAHELFHAIQNQGGTTGFGNKVPSWLTEGSAEWARDKYGGKNQSGYALKNNPTDPYTLGYGTAGGFLKYLDSKKPGGVVSFLNNVYGGSTQPYNEAMWQQTFGQPLQTLYNDYRTDLRRSQSVVTTGTTSNQVDTGKLYPVNSNTNVAFSSDGNTQYYFRPGQDPSKDQPFQTCINGKCT